MRLWACGVVGLLNEVDEVEKLAFERAVLCGFAWSHIRMDTGRTIQLYPYKREFISIRL